MSTRGTHSTAGAGQVTRPWSGSLLAYPESITLINNLEVDVYVWA
ncbi:MAG: hypothetical protein PVJ76_11215 [Gemmatimonadota bacterium]